MLILPLEKSIDWRKPPLFTFLLILTNTLILLITQSHDEKAFTDAINYYLSSQLPTIELPLYLKTKPHINSRLPDEELLTQIENKQANKNIMVYVLISMERDTKFMKKLHQREIVNQNHEKYKQWQEQRTHFEELQQQSFNQQYGFIPAKHEPLTFITHQFLHGGYGHLIGNMIFLFLIGVTLETALGGLLYFGCYLIAGLGAVSLYWLIYSTSNTVLVGASGAISGLMGMYAGVFGLRKIRFFYSILFYFDFIKAPALIMLPLWVMNELYQLYFTTNSNVAYVAHIGGLLTGGIISFTIKHYFNEKLDTHYLNESIEQDEKMMLYEQGLKYVRELKIAQAQRVFSNLYAHYPNDEDILIQYYKILKYTPENNEYDSVMASLFEIADNHNIKLINEVFKDYIKLRRNIKILPKTLVKMSVLFSKHNYQNDAEIIINTILRKSATIEGLDQALLALATSWQRQDNVEKYKHCLALLVKHYSTQAIGKNASMTLDRLNHQ